MYFEPALKRIVLLCLSCRLALSMFPSVMDITSTHLWSAFKRSAVTSVIYLPLKFSFSHSHWWSLFISVPSNCPGYVRKVLTPTPNQPPRPDTTLSAEIKWIWASRQTVSNETMEKWCGRIHVSDMYSTQKAFFKRWFGYKIPIVQKY